MKILQTTLQLLAIFTDKDIIIFEWYSKLPSKANAA